MGGVGRTMTGWCVAAVLTAVVVTGGCTSGASPDASPTPTLPSARASASPTAVTPKPTTPQQDALAAYERYITTTVEATQSGPPVACSSEAPRVWCSERRK
jgi:hypothetical protein